MPRWLLVLSLLLASAYSTRVSAEEAARIVLVKPVRSSQLLDEALVRTRGELKAVGLTLDEQYAVDADIEREIAFDAEVYGVLVFKWSGAVISVSAFARGDAVPVVQRIDTTDPEIDAEVVAVRAVESLRAVLLKTVGVDTEQSAPESIRRLTESESQATDRAPPQRSKLDTPAVHRRAPPEEDRSGGPSGQRTPAATEVSVAAGPAVLFDVGTPVISPGGQAALWLTRSWFSVGLSVGGLWSGNALDNAGGRASTRRLMASAQARAEARLSRSWALFTQLCAGVAHYDFSAQPADGFVSGDETHASARFCAELGGGYWLTNTLAAYLSVGASLATNPPAVRFAGSQIAVLERPAVLLSIGAVLGRR